MFYIFIQDVIRANELDAVIVVDTAESQDEAFQKLFAYAPMGAESWEDLKEGVIEHGCFGTMYTTEEIVSI